jgi:hypothetical protein
METTIVYAADKRSYGTEFTDIFDTLDELKKEIVKEEEIYARWKEGHEEYTDDMYTEELFKKWSKDGEYELYEIHLHEDEQIMFGEYHGKSWFHIEKKDENILSTMKRIEDS